MSNGKKEIVSATTFKKWLFTNEFRIETEDGQVLSALCKSIFPSRMQWYHARGNV